MRVATHWTLAPFTHQRSGFAARLRSARESVTPAAKAVLLDWENEGGTLAPSPVATDSEPTAGCA